MDTAGASSALELLMRKDRRLGSQIPQLEQELEKVYAGRSTSFSAMLA